MQVGRHEIAVVGERAVDQRLQVGIALRTGVGDVVAEIAPHLLARRAGAEHADEVEQQPEADRQGIAVAAVVAVGAQQVPDRVAELLLERLLGNLGAELPVFVHRPRDDPDVEALGALRLAEQVEAEALLGAVGQPLVDGQPVALGLGDFLAVLVEEQLVDHVLGHAPAQRADDAARLGDAVGQVLAAHLVIDPEREPAHRPVDLPLQLGLAAENALLDRLALIVEAHDAVRRVDNLDGDLEHRSALRADRQNRRIGRLPLGPKGGQHDVHDRLVALEHQPKGVVERARIVAIACRDELVVEAELVEKIAQHCVVMVREALVAGGERIGNAAQRLAQVSFHQRLVRHVVGHLAQPVHVVAERHQPRRSPAADDLVGAAHQRGAQHLLEGADMRQARGAIAGLEQHGRAAGLALGIPLDELHRLLERPGLGHAGGLDESVVDHARAFRGCCRQAQDGLP